MKSLRQWMAALLLTLLLLAMLSAEAQARIEVTPKVASAGTVVDISLTVSNERTDADTTKIEVVFDREQAVTSADTPSHPGWSSSVELGVSNVQRILWERGKLPPGQTETFVATITVPRTGDTLVLKTLQTYSDGKVDRWVDGPLLGGGEPQRPAPVIQVTGGAAATATTTVTTTATTPALPPAAEKTSGDSWPLGKVLIFFGVLTMIVVFTRARKKSQK